MLSGTDNPRRYWSDLKSKMKTEGSQVYEKIVHLKITAEDGKKAPELRQEQAKEGNQLLTICKQPKKTIMDSNKNKLSQSSPQSVPYD